MSKKYTFFLAAFFIVLVSPPFKIAGNISDELLTDQVFNDSIHTVLIYQKEQGQLSYPVIRLGYEEQLVISFDDFSNEVSDYHYEIIHCNMDWHQSPLLKVDYQEGFQQDRVGQYTYSINTTQAYIHYELIFPNEYIKPVVSGNYILRIFEGDPKNIILQRRFLVVDPVAGVEAQVRQPTETSLKPSSQEIDFSVYYDPDMYNPRQNVVTKIARNDPFTFARVYQPTYMDNEKLIYNFQENNIFPGGSEFRNFDLKNIRYLSPEIEEILYNPPFFQVYLHLDKARYSKPYFYDTDLNGKFKIEVERKDGGVEGDYSLVHFRLKSRPMLEGSVHVFGQLTSWQYSSNTKMIYNFETGEYESSLLLKQGYYNYTYLFVDNHTGAPDIGAIDGTYFDTENDYFILVYYRDISLEYDQLVGFHKLNSMN